MKKDGYHDMPYLTLLQEILDKGTFKGDRTGTGTQSMFGAQLKFDLSQGFPLLTTKKMFLRGIIHELLWFLSGDTNVKYLQDKKVKIWDEWATAEQCARFGRLEGDLGPVYGHQWRNFGATKRGSDSPIAPAVAYASEYNNDGIDQISQAVDLIKNNPNSRRIIVTGWNPAEATKVALPPCHTLFQFYVAEGKLSCQLYQRSADVFLGVPFNIASYALLTMMMAQVCGLQPGTFVHTFGDVHIYNNHRDQVQLQLSRYAFKSPTMTLSPEVESIFDFKSSDFQLDNYQCHPRIKAPIAV